MIVEQVNQGQGTSNPFEARQFNSAITTGFDPSRKTEFPNPILNNSPALAPLDQLCTGTTSQASSLDFSRACGNENETLRITQQTNPARNVPVLEGGVKVSAPVSLDGHLPSFGISQGSDLFLPDLSFALLDKTIQELLPPTQPVERASRVNAQILDAAKQATEAKSPPWVGSKYEPQVHNGRLAGAASVSKVLQGLGYNYADSANVGTLSNQLIKQGWQMVPLDQAKPGDVIYGGRLGKDWRKGGGNAHIGIVGEDGKILHNKSATGKWQADDMASSFPSEKYGDQVWVLRPPQTDSVPGPQPVNPRPNRPDRGIRPDVGPEPNPMPDVSPIDERTRPEDGGEKTGGVLGAAKRNVDRRLWAFSDFANSVKGGRLGCAASLSKVLQEAGYKYANSAGVGGMVDILRSHGWTKVPLSQAEAGDVVYGGKPGTRWWEGGGNAHIGVVGEEGKVYHNSSGKRRWVQDSLSSVFNSSRFGDQRYALRPPRRSA